VLPESIGIFPGTGKVDLCRVGWPLFASKVLLRTFYAQEKLTLNMIFDHQNLG